MAKVELVMPKLGESIMEATILKWNKQVGDHVEQDETILEIATDKVDSIVPSEVEGTITQLLFPEGAVVAIGAVIAIIETEVIAPGGADSQIRSSSGADSQIRSPQNGKHEEPTSISIPMPIGMSPLSEVKQPIPTAKSGDNARFYSPLVRTIAKKENIHLGELETLPGSGHNGRVTKSDMMGYVEKRKIAPVQSSTTPSSIAGDFNRPSSVTPLLFTPAVTTPSSPAIGGNVEIIEMDRMRRLIADHMVMSKHTSPHVTSFVEADVTNMVNWRNKVKGDFQNQYGTNITFTPIFVEAVVKAIKDFPMINISVDGTKIIVKRDINIGIATALPSGNLIVPVIKNADLLNLAGLTKVVNDLAARARMNQLKPEEIQNGTFTLTNVGTFGNVMGTPIINQPQAAILATGAIRKRPAVLETEYGDVIAIRQMMFLSLSYDHRVVDGFLGGSFLRRIADYLEQFDGNRKI